MKRNENCFLNQQNVNLLSCCQEFDQVTCVMYVTMKILQLVEVLCFHIVQYVSNLHVKFVTRSLHPFMIYNSMSASFILCSKGELERDSRNKYFSDTIQMRYSEILNTSCLIKP